MTLIRYQPWTLMNQLNRELNQMLESPAAETATDWVPAIDVKEEAGRWVVHADVPGVDPKDIEITMDDGALTLRGSRQAESRQTQDGWVRVERASGAFYRRFTLPDTADSAGISAKTLHGVLEITIPKQAKVQPKRIPVNG
jgi:HSP20 family protein